MTEKKVQYKILYDDVLNYKKKRHARVELNKAVRKGHLKRPMTCKLCNKRGITQAHHVDYGKPLNVIWLCQKCHVKAHEKDSVLNPENNIQTDANLDDDFDQIAVTFYLPAKNYVALINECRERGLSISNRVRQIVTDEIRVQAEQLTFFDGD